MPRAPHVATREIAARLVTGPVAARYLGGERPETFGIKAIQGRRQKFYDLAAINAVLDRLSGMASSNDNLPGPLDALIEEWR